MFFQFRVLISERKANWTLFLRGTFYSELANYDTCRLYAGTGGAGTAHMNTIGRLLR